MVERVKFKLGKFTFQTATVNTKWSQNLIELNIVFIRKEITVEGEKDQVDKIRKHFDNNSKALGEALKEIEV